MLDFLHVVHNADSKRDGACGAKGHHRPASPIFRVGKFARDKGDATGGEQAACDHGECDLFLRMLFGFHICLDAMLSGD